MMYEEQLRQMLAPLGVYDLDAPINSALLKAEGAMLDTVQAMLDELSTESDLTLAGDWGLEEWKSLFGIPPAAGDTDQRRQAVQSLLRIGFGPCSLKSIQSTLSGCGLPTQVQVVDTGKVRVSFPGLAGRPDDLEQLMENVEQILPAHIGIEYVFNILTWSKLQSKKWTFADVESMSWKQLEAAV